MVWSPYSRTTLIALSNCAVGRGSRGNPINGVGDQRIDAPCEELVGARGVVHRPGDDAQAGVVELADALPREQRVLDVHRDAAEARGAFPPVVRDIVGEISPRQIGSR